MFLFHKTMYRKQTTSLLLSMIVCSRELLWLGSFTCILSLSYCANLLQSIFSTNSRGAFIREYVGEVLGCKEFKHRAKQYARDHLKHYYFMALNSDEVIDATGKGNISRFINHSCDPNAETQKVGRFCCSSVFHYFFTWKC